jgi:hypothetical protein
MTWGTCFFLIPKHPLVLFAVVAISFKKTVVVDAISSYLVIALPFIARVTSYDY